MGLRSYNITEPYDFFFCFIFGCFLRIFFLLLKKMFKNSFNIKDNNYVYNEPDNAEKLYEVKKKLNEFSKNLNNTREDKIDNINNNFNINNDEIENKIKLVNDKLKKLEKLVINLGQGYEEEKNHIKVNLKTIEECQKFIIDSLKPKEKED